MEGSDEVRSRDELLCSVDRTKLPPMLHTMPAMENKHVYTCVCVRCRENMKFGQVLFQPVKT